MANPTIKPFPNMMTTYVDDSMKAQLIALKKMLGLPSDAATIRHLMEYAIEEIVND